MKMLAVLSLAVALWSASCAMRPSSPATPTAPPIVRWTSDEDAVELPLAVIVEKGEPTDVAVFLPFLGTEEAFVIDTGANRSWISEELGLAKNLPTDGTVKALGLGNSKALFRKAVAPRIDLGFAVLERWTLTVGRIPSIDRRNVSWYKNGKPVIRGLIGADLLHALGATIDYREQKIRFRKPAANAP